MIVNLQKNNVAVEEVSPIGLGKISLKKNQVINLKKSSNTLRKLKVGLGWDEVKSFGLFSNTRNSNLDLDTVIIATEANFANPKVCSYLDKYILDNTIFIPQDNVDGGKDGDDENGFIDLESLNPKYKHIIIGAYIYNANSKKQDFTKVNNCFIRLEDEQTHKELMRYEISIEKNNRHTGFCMAILNKDENGEWFFQTIGEFVDAVNPKEASVSMLNLFRN